MIPEIIFGLAGAPLFVISRNEVTMPIERQVNGKVIYDYTGYIAVQTRPATQEEVRQWKAR